MKKLLMIVLFCISGVQTAYASCTETSSGCVEPGQFNLALALGAGQRTNPLHNGENVPLLLMPDVSYYGEYWFWDNTTAGYSLLQQPDFVLSLVVKLNQEKGYFQRWFAGNLMTYSTSSTMLPPEVDTGATKQMSMVSVSEVNKRPTAWDAGVQMQWFGDDWQLGLNLMQDASGTYHGQNATASASTFYPLLGGHLQLGANLHWKSRKLIDTYYGLDESELFYLARYQGKDSWQPELRLGWQKALTPKWSLLSFYRMLLLDDAMTDSPLVKNSRVQTWFVGVSYQFF
ncbi:MipA/OmpV family protein [Rheinheimera marina]|uniref:MipA/OmpV family protein n=1 Tax=Rheinheimera marina TaxID=1774958 RepID=A0ABV9JG49_9GAMM